MKNILVLFGVLLGAAAHAQAGETKCLSYSDLITASKLDTSKEEAFFQPFGFYLSGNNYGTRSYSGDELDMVSLKRDSSGAVIETTYNIGRENCFTAIEKVMLADLKKDIKWEGGVSASTGYKNETYGVFLYQAKTFVENNGLKTFNTSYIVTVYPLALYNAKVAKYKSNPKLKITQY